MGAKKSNALGTKKSLLALLALTFLVLLMATPGVFLQPDKEPISLETKAEAGIPTLKEGAIRPEFTARTVYAVDLASGKVLFSKNADEPVLPASTTKIASALVALNHYGLYETVVVGDIGGVEGQKMELEEGEEISVRNLLYGVLVYSANDAAEALARAFPGGREAFVAEMNNLAKKVKLTKTHFTNPTGIDEYLHFSTARDLATLAAYALENPVFATIVATPKLDVASNDGKIIHRLVNLNELVGRVPGVLGVKTGWTINSGESLVTFMERDGRRIVIALMGSEDRFGETEELIDWIFTHYSWEQ